jgi:hypothetical protein
MWSVLGGVVGIVLILGIVLIIRRVEGGRSVPSGGTKVLQARVRWPGGGKRTFGVVNKPDAQYLVDQFPDRTAALAFLRGCEVQDERVYVIAENPQGHLGRDLVMIFEESTGEFVEFGVRTPLPEPRFSSTDCARCGYVVIPTADPRRDFGSTAGVRIWLVDLEGLEKHGNGYQCTSCRALACASCYRAVPQGQGELDLRCWLCGEAVEVLTD